MKKKIVLMFMMIFFMAGCADSDSQPSDFINEDHPEQESEVVSTTMEDDEETEDSSTSQDRKNNSNEEENTAKNLNELKVHYIDAGQADATLFQYEDKAKTYTILYDTGDWKRNDVINYLAAVNISYIDLIIISHPDADHIGQLAEIMKTYDVGEVWMSGNESTSQTFQNALEAILATDAGYEEPRAGDKTTLGPMELKVLHPDTISGKANEESLSILFTYGENSFLFTGDAGKADEKEMISRTSLQADILQLGHHGSNTSSDPAFIKEVDPDIAIYSAGEGNSYGHPHEEVIDLMQNEGIEVYGTDVHGTIVVTSDGKEFTIETKEDGTISPTSSGSSHTEQSDAESKGNENVDAEKENSGCVNINKASQENLQKIIHIGEKRVEELVELRPFDSVDDLTRINGIGPARIEDIKSEGIACTGG